MELSDRIMIDKNPTRAMLGPQGKLLFVLHDGWPLDYTLERGWGRLRKASSIDIIDVKSNKLIRNIQLGWAAARMVFSEDKSRLLVLSTGHPQQGGTRNDAEMAHLTMISTSTGEVEFNIFKWCWIQQIVYKKDFSRIAVLGVNEFESGIYNRNFTFLPYFEQLKLDGLRPKHHQVTVINSIGEILNEVELPAWEKQIKGNFIEMYMSKSIDERWLYVFDPGEKERENDKLRASEVYFIEFETGEITDSKKLGYSGFLLSNPYLQNNKFVIYTSPDKSQQEIFEVYGNNIGVKKALITAAYLFAPVKEPAGYYSIGAQKVTFVSDQLDSIVEVDVNELFDKYDYIRRIITSAVYLESINRVLVTTSGYTYGIINPLTHRLEKAGVIGRQEIRNSKTALTVLGAFTLPVSPLVGAATISAFQSHTNLMLNPHMYSQEISSDEKQIYCLELSSNDVTMINTEVGTRDTIAAIGYRYKGLVLTPDNRFLWALSTKHLVAFNTRNYDLHIDYDNPPETGEVKGVEFLDSGNLTAVLYDNRLQIWDTENKSILKTIFLFPSAEFFFVEKR